MGASMTGTRDPVSVVTTGSVILGEVLAPGGFNFQLIGTGPSSGGDFAVGQFTKGSQYLQFHFRDSLGQVVYGRDGATLSHVDYLRGLAVTGAYDKDGSRPQLTAARQYSGALATTDRQRQISAPLVADIVQGHSADTMLVCRLLH
jgi:hypothetical protein